MKEEDPEKRKTIGVNTLCLATILLDLTVGLVFCLMTRSRQLSMAVSIEFILMWLILGLNFRRRHKLAMMVFFSTMLIATFYISALLGKSVEGQLMIIFLTALSIFLFDELITQIGFILASVCVLVATEVNFKYGFIPEIHAAPDTLFLIRWAAYLSIILLVIITFFWYKRNFNIILGIVRNFVTEKEHAWQKEVEENKQKDRFISNAYHEVRTAFFTLIRITSVLDNTKNRKETGQAVRGLKAATEEARHVIDNILEFEKNYARQETLPELQLENVNIRALVKNLLDIYQYTADEDQVRLELEIASGLPINIVTDRTKWQQIFTNLLMNAIRHTGYGSVIGIRIGYAGDVWSLSVTDQGKGIDKVRKQDIFLPFVTTNPKGVGLGLYIVKQSVVALHGEIRVEDNVPQGTVFTVRLPILAGYTAEE